MKHYFWAIIWAVLVLFLVSSPMPDVTDSRHSFPGIDKLVHTGFFFVFTILMFYGSLMNNHEPNLISWPNLMVLGSASVFAVGTELIQKFFFDYRSFEYWDIFADHVGIGMAYFAYLVLVLTIRKIRE